MSKEFNPPDNPTSALFSFGDIQRSIKKNQHLSKKEFLENIMDYVVIGTALETVSGVYDSYKVELRKEKIKNILEDDEGTS